MNAKLAQLNIERGEHHNAQASSWLDNMLLATGLLVLGYFPIFNLYVKRQAARGLVYAFPIIALIASAILSFNVMVNAVYGYKFNKLGHVQLESLGTPVFNDTPNLLLSLTVFRAFIIPVCI